MSYYDFNIPDGREVIITLNDQNVFQALGVLNVNPIKLIYTSDTSLKLKSDYRKLVEVNSNVLLTLLSGATNGLVPSGQFGLQGLQVWENTSPLDFTLDVELHMIDSGRNDVVIPALSLQKLCLPSYSEKGSSKGWGLVPPGPNLSTILSLVKAQLSSTDFAAFGNRSDGKATEQGGGLLSIQIGKYLKIDNVVLKGAEPTFSATLDEDYMPVSCKMQLDFTTVEIATTNMIDKMLTHVKSVNVSPSPPIVIPRIPSLSEIMEIR